MRKPNHVSWHYQILHPEELRNTGAVRSKRSTAADAYLRSQGVIGRSVAAYGLASCLRMTIGTEADMDFIFGALERFIDSESKGA